MPVEQYFAPGQIEPMRVRLQAFADDFGVQLGSPARISNTRAPLAAAEYARDEGKLGAFWEAAMHAHWRDGRDLEDDEVLGSLASDVGLDPDATVAYHGRDDDAFRQTYAAYGVGARRFTNAPVQTPNDIDNIIECVRSSLKQGE